MLNKKTLIEKVGIKYKPMIDQISIPDFTKCIAQFSGIYIQNLKDEVICDYLSNWCINKKKFFDLMGGKIKVDIPFNYKDQDTDYRDKFIELGHEFPVYYPWLEMISPLQNNKISMTYLRYTDYSHLIRDAFNGIVNVEGMAITRFFKQHLNAPDELITKIGGIFENKEVQATFTISIDPVDMMLASENPYGWNSCYRLETDGFSDSHADGCLAAVLDHNSLITYVWNNHGKFSLYDNYEFKDIRYKRMRMTIAVADDFKAVHFNTIYPGKGNYTNDFLKMFRDVVETFLSEKGGFRNMWKQDYNRASCYRDIFYGYSEYSDNDVWIQSDATDNYEIIVFDVPIHCPCGCGEILPYSYENDDYNYNGDGFNHNNFYNEHWCDCTEEYEDCDGDCDNCRTWNIYHAMCELDENEYCERDSYEIESSGDANFDQDNIVSCNPDHCSCCPLFRQHKPGYFIDIIIKDIENNKLYARVHEDWYIKNKDKYYSINDNKVENEVFFDSEDLDRITTNLLNNNNCEDAFEIYEKYPDGLKEIIPFAASEENDYNGSIFGTVTVGADLNIHNFTIPTDAIIGEINNNISLTTTVNDENVNMDALRETLLRYQNPNPYITNIWTEDLTTSNPSVVSDSSNN